MARHSTSKNLQQLPYCTVPCNSAPFVLSEALRNAHRGERKCLPTDTPSLCMLAADDHAAGPGGIQPLLGATEHSPSFVQRSRDSASSLLSASAFGNIFPSQVNAAHRFLNMARDLGPARVRRSLARLGSFNEAIP